MSNLVIKQFQGFDVRFEKRDDGKVWGCLTDMAKATGKLVPEYMRLGSTQELLTALGDDSIDVKRGRNGGTWGIEEVTIDFGYWSNIVFRLWVIDSIKDLMTKGFATMQLATESSEDYKKRHQILEEENRLLLTKVGYLEAWSPRMSLEKMRYLEMIGYTPDDHSPILKSKESLREYLYSPESDWDVREGRIVQDLVDTLFNPGTKINIDTYRFDSVQSLLKYLPSKFYSLSVNSPHTYKQVPREGYEQFERSIKVKHDDYSYIWLEFMPKKKEAIMKHLQTK